MKLNHARLDCAGCGSKMQVFHVGEVEVDRCGYCGGLWLDAGEVGRIVGKKLALKRSKRLSERQCPRCKTPMSVAKVADVPVEFCGTCRGTFFDQGELEQVGARPMNFERRGREKPLTFECPGCARTIRLEDGQRTQWGLACHICAPTLSFGSPADMAPGQPGPFGPPRAQQDPAANLGVLGALMDSRSSPDLLSLFGNGSTGQPTGGWQVLSVMLVLGLVFTFIGGRPVLQRLTMSEQATARGRVVELRHESGSMSRRSSLSVEPFIQFTDANGAVHTFGTGTYSSPPMYSLGESVGVTYDARHPENATVSDDSDPLGTLALFGGLFLLVCGGAWVVFVRRFNQSVHDANKGAQP